MASTRASPCSPGLPPSAWADTSHRAWWWPPWSRAQRPRTPPPAPAPPAPPAARCSKPGAGCPPSALRVSRVYIRVILSSFEARTGGQEVWQSQSFLPTSVFEGHFCRLSLANSSLDKQMRLLLVGQLLQRHFNYAFGLLEVRKVEEWPSLSWIPTQDLISECILSCWDISHAFIYNCALSLGVFVTHFLVNGFENDQYTFNLV